MKYTARGRRRSVLAASRGSVSQEDVNELVLYITNDGQLYSGKTTAIVNNLKRKIKSGKYDPTLAVKAWMYLADDGVRKYDKEFGSGTGKLFLNKATREAIAEELAEYYDDWVHEDDVSASTRVSRRRKPIKAAKLISDAFDGYTPWSGAKDTAEALDRYDKWDALANFIDEVYYNEDIGEGVIDETKLNDLLWFEPGYVAEAVGLYYDEETGEWSDEPFDEDSEEDE